MYSCPKCGGNLIYDISTQTLKCKYCENYVNPYSVEKTSDGTELDTYEATIFTCPQCGGEIISNDETAAGFCSYCGASTILTSRLSNEKRPKWIAPFEITKEECRQIYADRMKKSIFAPKAIKNPEYIEGFRGIYMPYWKYEIKQEGDVVLLGDTSHRAGDYIITNHCCVKMDVFAEYNGFTYDASSSFYDGISEKVAPFRVNEAKEFTPSLLSGFYADIADVPEKTYEGQAVNRSCDNMYDNIKSTKIFSDMDLPDDKNHEILEKKFADSCKSIEGMMLPVWFMSYRKKDRVSYAVINGQSGKMVADIPIDTKKYGIFSILLAIPIFFLLNMFFTLQPALLLKIISFVAALTSAVYLHEIRDIHNKEEHNGDIGLTMKKIRTMDDVKVSVKISSSFNVIKKNLMEIIILLLCIGGLVSKMLKYIVWPATLGITIICVSLGIKYHKKDSSVKGEYGFFSSLIAVLINFIISITNPVMDQYYYIGAVIAIIAVLITVMCIIRNYNMLSSRRLPQFNRRGGDDCA